jgi:2-keto-3-deoxy-L-rhamnonate aldolase RhmA
MFVNSVKLNLKQGLPAIGHWLSLPSPSIAELMVSFGPDWLVIDTEHGPANWERVEDILRAMKGTSVVPIVRIVNNDVALFKQAFDRGAYGVIVPMVNTPEEARAAVAACKYPPDGCRGVAGSRVTRYGMDLPDYFAEWNRQVLVILQIETPEGLTHVDAIAAVPGVDVLFVGPSDLSANMGIFREFAHPDFLAALDRVKAAAKTHGVAAGYMASSAEETVQCVAEGFQFVAAGTDARLLAGAAGTVYSKIRQGLSALNPSKALPAAS